MRGQFLYTTLSQVDPYGLPDPVPYIHLPLPACRLERICLASSTLKQSTYSDDR